MKKNCSFIKTSRLNALIRQENNTLIMAPANKEEFPITYNASSNFNITLTNKEDIVLFYKDLDGTAFMSRLMLNGKQENRRLNSIDAFTSSKNCFYFYHNQSGPCFVYTKITNDKKYLSLYVKDFSANKDIKIDSISPMKSKDFYYFHSETPLIIYKNMKNHILVCRLGGEYAENFTLTNIFNNGDSITDLSAITKNGETYISFISVNNAQNHLIYKYINKENTIITKYLGSQKYLWGTIIFRSNSTIFIFALGKNNSLYTFSNDNGNNFYPLATYFKKLNITGKAEFISINSTDFLAHEIFINSTTPLLINDFMHSENINLEEKYKEDISSLQNKIATFEKEIKSKNDHLEKIMNNKQNFTKNYSAEFNKQLKAQWKNTNEEKESLTTEISSLKNAVNSLNKQIVTLTETEKVKDKIIKRLTEENIILKKSKSLFEEELYNETHPLLP